MDMIKLFMIFGVSLIVITALIVFQMSEEPEMFEDIDVCKIEFVCFSARVTSIIDGDTIGVVHLTTGEPLRIRLALVDTPEIGEELYEAAKDFTASLCPVNSRIIFDQDDGQEQGSFNRDIGIVFCSGVLLNEKLLEASLAVIDTSFCEVSEYSDDLWAKRFGC